MDPPFIELENRSVEETAARYRLSLEHLLGRAVEGTSHPAAQTLAQIDRLLERGQSGLELDQGMGAALAYMLNDVNTWAVYRPWDTWAALGGESVRRALQPRLVDPEQFHDAMAEVRLLGQIRVAGLRAEFEVAEGRPDLYLLDQGAKVFIEAKRIRPSTPAHALGRAVKKANSQIKKATPDHNGALHVSIGEPYEWTLDQTLQPSMSTNSTVAT